MGTVVLDASVVLALFDPHDALHRCAAVQVRAFRDAGARFVLPGSALAEVLVGAARQGEAALQDRHRATVAAFGLPHPLDEAVAVAAARRRARHRLRLPDALVLGTSDAVGATTVLTGDKRWRGLDDTIHVIGADAGHPAP